VRCTKRATSPGPSRFDGMRVSLAVLALAAASQAASIPLCSAICVTNAIAGTGCLASDTTCICSSDTFLSSVANCAEATCKGDLSAMASTEGLCASAGLKVEMKRSVDSEKGHGKSTVHGGKNSWWGGGRWSAPKGNKGGSSSSSEGGHRGWSPQPEGTSPWQDWGSGGKGNNNPSPPKHWPEPVKPWPKPIPTVW